MYSSTNQHANINIDISIFGNDSDKKDFVLINKNAKILQTFTIRCSKDGESCFKLITIVGCGFIAYTNLCDLNIKFQQLYSNDYHEWY